MKKERQHTDRKVFMACAMLIIAWLAALAGCDVVGCDPGHVDNVCQDDPFITSVDGDSNPLMVSAARQDETMRVGQSLAPHHVRHGFMISGARIAICRAKV